MRHKHRTKHSRIQRAYLKWYANNAAGFAVTVRVLHYTRSYMTLAFDGYPDTLRGGLSEDCVSVYVPDMDEPDSVFDFLNFFEGHRVRVKNGSVVSQRSSEESELIGLEIRV